MKEEEERKQEVNKKMKELKINEEAPEEIKCRITKKIMREPISPGDRFAPISHPAPSRRLSSHDQW